MAAKAPPDTLALAAAHRARQQQLAARATAETGRLWGFLQTLGWAGISDRTLSTVRSALTSAAHGAQDYVTAALRMWGTDPDPAGQVAERAFALTASDGRPLDTLLEQPSREVQALVAQGMPAEQANEIGRRHLQRIVATQVADVARTSTGVAMVADRKVVGYIRLLTLPSCNRCIILAGNWYRWSKGFERHPLCDCVHVPSAEVTEPGSPKTIYNSLDDEQRRKAGWSGHDQRAIEDGADLYQVTNYKRALKTVTIAGQPVKTTAIGTNRRSLAGKRLGATGRRPNVTRWTPEAIYLDADRLGWDRDATIRELKRHGFIL